MLSKVSALSRVRFHKRKHGLKRKPYASATRALRGDKRQPPGLRKQGNRREGCVVRIAATQCLLVHRRFLNLLVKHILTEHDVLIDNFTLHGSELIARVEMQDTASRREVRYDFAVLLTFLVHKCRKHGIREQVGEVEGIDQVEPFPHLGLLYAI